MNKPIKVLWLDDEAEDLISDFRPSAQMNRVIIKEYFTDAKNGKEYLLKNKDKIDAVIIDGYFLAKPGSSKTKNITALKTTVDELRKILYKDDYRIPFCVFTGYLDELEGDSILSDIRVFTKGKDDVDMFNYLKDQVADNPNYQIKCKYEEIFDLFGDDLLPEDKEIDLLEILKKVDSKAKYNDDDAFTPIRKMYEVMIGQLRDEVYAKNKYQDIVHNDLFDQKGKLNITGSYFYLSGYDVKYGDDIIIDKRHNPVWPKHVANLTNLILDISQKNSHPYPEDIHHYAYKSAVYALLELLLWYKNFINNYH